MRARWAQKVPQVPHRNPLPAQEPPPPSWPGTVPGTPQGPPFLYKKTLPGPFLDPFLHRNPPPNLHKNPLQVPLPRHFVHRNPPLPVPGVSVYCPIGSSQTPLSHRGIANTHAMQLRPCLESLGISVVPPMVKLCEAPRSWHHLTRLAHDVTPILRDCRAQNKIRVRYALGLRQKGLVIGYGLRCGFFLRTASHNPWRSRKAIHACVQSWEWAGHNTCVLQPPGRNSLAVSHQRLSLHVSCPHTLAEPEHPSTATRPEGHSGSLRSHRHRASPLLITCWASGPGHTAG